MIGQKFRLKPAHIFLAFCVRDFVKKKCFYLLVWWGRVAIGCLVESRISSMLRFIVKISLYF